MNVLHNTDSKIQYFLPQYHFNEIHSKTIRASTKKIYPVIRHLDFNASRVTRWLFKIRGLSLKNLCFDEMVDNGSFFTIYEKENEEWVIGLLSESLKTPSRLESQQSFNNWNPGRGLKIVWNFRLNTINSNMVIVSTETRVLCLNKKVKLIFSVYWFFIRPFSGLIRKEMLRILKNKCEP